MPTYSIGVAPQAVAQGFQSDVTVYNRGPDIVWLGDDTSVTPLTGFAVYPGDSVTWQEKTPLYAVARLLLPYSQTDMPNQTGRAELQVTDAASILVPNSERTELLYTFADPFLNQGPLQRVNVARYQAVQVLYYKPTVRSDASPDYITISVLWHDADGNVVDDSVYNGAMGQFTNTLTLPVKGIYMSVNVFASDGATNAEIPLERLRLVGTTLPLPQSWDFTPFLWYQNATGVVGNGVINGIRTDRGAMWRTSDLSGAAPNLNASTRIYTPNITDIGRFYVQLSATITALRHIKVSNPVGTSIIARDVYNWTSGNNIAVFDLSNDLGTVSYMRLSGTVTPANLTYDNIAVTYLD